MQYKFKFCWKLLSKKIVVYKNNLNVALKGNNKNEKKK